jgi:hypothetical protein
VDSYPTESPGADHTDVLFSKKFPVGKRHLIAETYVIHLDSEKGGPMGANWNGRKTRHFGPDPIEEPVLVIEPPVQAPEDKDSPYVDQTVKVRRKRRSWLERVIRAVIAFFK